MKEKLKSHFLGLYSMIMADGIVVAKELETLYRIGRENYNLTPDEINQYIVSSGTSFIVPESVEERIRILYELSEIAWADGAIDSTEKNLLHRYVIRLGFLEENAENIVTFLLEQVKNGISLEEVLKEIANT